MLVYLQYATFQAGYDLKSMCCQKGLCSKPF